MSDLVERLREYASDDHERGCSGRYYDCHCGYDGKRDQLIDEAAARIEQLEDAVLRGNKTWNALSDQCDAKDARIEQLEAALREWESAMNKLSMRVGLTPQNIADVLNPIMDTTHAALKVGS